MEAYEKIPTLQTNKLKYFSSIQIRDGLPTSSGSLVVANILSHFHLYRLSVFTPWYFQHCNSSQTQWQPTVETRKFAAKIHVNKWWGQGSLNNHSQGEQGLEFGRLDTRVQCDQSSNWLGSVVARAITVFHLDLVHFMTSPLTGFIYQWLSYFIQHEKVCWVLSTFSPKEQKQPRKWVKLLTVATVSTVVFTHYFRWQVSSLISLLSFFQSYLA